MVKKQATQNGVSTNLVHLINDICPLEAPSELCQEQQGAVSKRRAAIPSAGQEAKTIPASPPMLVKQQMKDSEFALQQLRSRERTQLEKLRQLKQRRRSQQLAEEHRQLEELYRRSDNDFSTARSTDAGESAAARVERTHQLHQKTSSAQSAHIKRQATPTRKGSSHHLASAVTAGLGSPSAAADAIGHNPQPVLAVASPPQRTATANTDLDVPPDTGCSQPMITSVAVPIATPDAESCNGSGQKQRRRLSKSPAARATASPAAHRATSASPARATRQSAGSNPSGDYDRPWRANMKAPTQHQAVAVDAGTKGNAAERAAAQLLAAAVDTSKPLVLKSKKRTPEEQAQLKEFMKRQQQQQLQLQREEKKQQAEAAARRMKVLKEIAAQQREAARQHQQQLSTGGATVWEPEQSWKGVLTPSSQASHASLLDDYVPDIPLQQLQQPEHQQQHLQQSEVCSSQQQQTAAQYLMQQQPCIQQQQQQIPVSTLAWEHQQLLHSQQVVQQHQQQLQFHEYEAAAVAERQENRSSGGMRDTGGGSKQRRSPLRSSIGGSKRSRDVSPGKAYFQEKQALIAANLMARREYDERLRARAAVISKAAAATGSHASPAGHVVGYAAAPSPSYGNYAIPRVVGRASSKSRSPMSAKTPMATTAAAGKTSKEAGRTRSSSKRGSPGSAAKVRRIHRKAPSAVVGEVDQQRPTAKKQRQQQQQQQMFVGTDQDVTSGVQAAVVYVGDGKRLVTPVRDQQAPAGAGAAAAAAGGGGGSQSALASFWAQQHAADTRHVSSNALIQEILHKSNLLKSRIEHICSKALQQQAQQKDQQQQRQPEQHQSPLKPQLLADNLIGVQDTEQQVISELAQEQQRLQDDFEAVRNHEQVGIVASDDEGEVEEATALMQESSKLQQQPWHQKLRSQLLEGDTGLPIQQQQQEEEVLQQEEEVLRQHHQVQQGCSESDHSRGGYVGSTALGGARFVQQFTDSSSAICQQNGPLLTGLKEFPVGGYVKEERLNQLQLLQQQQQLTVLQPYVEDDFTAADSTSSSSSDDDDDFHGYNLPQHTKPAAAAAAAAAAADGASLQQHHDRRHLAIANGQDSMAAVEDDDHDPDVVSSAQLLQPPVLVSLDQLVSNFAAAVPDSEQHPTRSSIPTAAQPPQSRGDLTARLRESLNKPREVPETHPGTSCDHQPGSGALPVVTWYSAMGGFSPGVDDRVAASPEADSPPDKEGTTAGLRLPWPTLHAGDIAARASAASRSMSSDDYLHWQQRQQQQQKREEGECGVGDRGEGSEVGQLPQWSGRPEWAAAGSNSYRWDVISSSSDSTSDDDADSATAAVYSCEQLVKEHEALQQQQHRQQQQQQICLSRRELDVARDPQHQVECARREMQQWLAAADEEDEQQQQQQHDHDRDDVDLEEQEDLFSTPVRGDPNSIINTFLRMHAERVQRLKQQQQQAQQQQQQQQPDEPQPVQLIAITAGAPGGDADSSKHKDELLEQRLHLIDKNLQIVEGNNSQQQQEPSGNQTCTRVQQQQQGDQTSVLEKRLADVEQLLQHQCHLLGRSVSPTQTSVGMQEQQEYGTASIDNQRKQQQQTDLHMQQRESCDSAAAGDCAPDWLDQFMQQQQQQRADGAAAGASAGQQQQQQRRRMLSPDTLQRMHEQNLAKLETAQEAEVDLLMLQQAQELVLLQQEAARVARDLDQQQFLALVQQQQQAAAREQIEHSAGLFQRVTKGVLDETFGQLKEVSALFAAQIKDSSRRSFGVQAGDDALDGAASVGQKATSAAAAEDAASDKKNKHQQQVLHQSYSQDGFEESSEDSQLYAVEAAVDAVDAVQPYTAVLPEDEPHPVLHFQALLKAEQTAAAAAATRSSTKGTQEWHADVIVEEKEALLQPNAHGSSGRWQQQQQYSAEFALVDEADMLGVTEEQSTVVNSESFVSDIPAEALSAETGTPAKIDDITEDTAAAATAAGSPSVPIAQEPTMLSADDAGLLKRSSFAPKLSVTEGQQYGSSSFESYKDNSSSSSSSMMRAQYSKQLLQEQLSAAERELSALSLHIDAIMVGYAVQALQAARDKNKQAAIHQQALKEQQQKADEKQKLVGRIQQLKQQLGMEVETTTESRSHGLQRASNSSVAAAAAAAASFLATATAAATPEQQRQPLAAVQEPSHISEEAYQVDADSADAVVADEDLDATADCSVAASLVEESLEQQSHCSSPVSQAPEEEGPAALASTAAAAAAGSSASEVDYSNDFHDGTTHGISQSPAAAPAPQILPYGTTAAGSTAAAAAGSSSKLQLAGQLSDMIEREVDQSPSSSLDSLQQKQQEVAALQSLVQREYEKQKLAQQQQALQQLLLQLRAGVASTAAAAGATAAATPTAADMRSASLPQLAGEHNFAANSVAAATAAAAASLSAIAVATSSSAAAVDVTDAEPVYSDDFVASAVDPSEDLPSLLTGHSQQQQQKPTSIATAEALDGDMAEATTTTAAAAAARDDVCMIDSAADIDRQLSAALSVSQVSDQLITSEEIQISVLAEDEVQSPPAAAAAAAVMGTSVQGYSESGFLSEAGSSAAAAAAAMEADTISVSAVEGESRAAGAAAAIPVDAYEHSASEVSSELLLDGVELEFSAEQPTSPAAAAAAEVEGSALKTAAAAAEGAGEQQQESGADDHELKESRSYQQQEAKQYWVDEQQQQNLEAVQEFDVIVKSHDSVLRTCASAADDDDNNDNAGDDDGGYRQQGQYSLQFGSFAELDEALFNGSLAAGSKAAAAAAAVPGTSLLGSSVAPAAAAADDERQQALVGSGLSLQFGTFEETAAAAAAAAETAAVTVEPALVVAEIQDLDPAEFDQDDGLHHDGAAAGFTGSGFLSSDQDTANTMLMLSQQQPQTDSAAGSLAAAAAAAAADDIVAPSADSSDAGSVDDDDVISELIQITGSESEDTYEVLLLMHQQQQQQRGQQQLDDTTMGHEAEKQDHEHTAVLEALPVASHAAADPATAAAAAAATRFGGSRSGVLSSSGGSGVLSLRPRRSSIGDGADIISVKGEGSRCMSTVTSADFEYSDWELGQRELSGFISCEPIGTVAAAGIAAAVVDRDEVDAEASEAVLQDEGEVAVVDDDQVALQDATAVARDARLVDKHDRLVTRQQQQQHECASVVQKQQPQQSHMTAAESAVEGTESYSLDFNSISMQVSEVAEGTAAQATAAQATAAAAAEAAATQAGIETAVDVQAMEPAEAAIATADELPGSSSSSSRRPEQDLTAVSESHSTAAAAASDPNSLVDLISSATFDEVLAEVLHEAVVLCSPVKQPQQQQQQQQKVSGASSGTDSADTADTADSSGSHSIQPDWQSSPGSTSPYSSPLRSQIYAAAAAAGSSSSSSRAELVSHPPTDWTPLADGDDAATPWSAVNAAAAAGTNAGAESALEPAHDTAAATAAAGGDEAAVAAAADNGLSGTAMQLDALLAEVADEEEQANEVQAAQVNAAAAATLQQQQQQQEELCLSMSLLGEDEQLDWDLVVGDDDLPLSPMIAAGSSDDVEITVSASNVRQQQQQQQERDHSDDQEDSLLPSSSTTPAAQAAEFFIAAAGTAEELSADIQEEQHGNSSVLLDSATAAADGDGDGVPLPASARDSVAGGADNDDEFDWPEASTAVDGAYPNTAEQAAAAAAAAAPLRRRTPSPPPLLVDDTPEHVAEYVKAIMTMPGLTDRLPDVLPPNAEPLQLEGYLWLEKEGHPEWSRLADGSDSDERHIFHKALYDATHQAILQVYAEANRLQAHPCCEAAGPVRVLKPLGGDADVLSSVTDKVVGWTRQRVRDEAGLDRLLADDAQEEDKSWQNLQQEVAEIALEVAAGIWDDLMNDTAEMLAAL